MPYYVKLCYRCQANVRFCGRIYCQKYCNSVVVLIELYIQFNDDYIEANS